MTCRCERDSLSVSIREFCNDDHVSVNPPLPNVSWDRLQPSLRPLIEEGLFHSMVKYYRAHFSVKKTVGKRGSITVLDCCF